MLFLVIDDTKLDNVKPEILVDQINMLKQTFELYEEMKRKGKLKLSYGFADMPGVLTIWDVESNDELQQILFLLPSMRFVNRSVRPLTEMKSILNVINELASILNLMPK